MTDESDPESEKAQLQIYQIRIKGHLPHAWTDWFAGLTMTALANGDTLLTGPVVDQAALYGVLRKVRDIGMPLLAVNGVKPEQKDPLDVKQMYEQPSQSEFGGNT